MRSHQFHKPESRIPAFSPFSRFNLSTPNGSASTLPVPYTRVFTSDFIMIHSPMMSSPKITVTRCFKIPAGIISGVSWLVLINEERIKHLVLIILRGAGLKVLVKKLENSAENVEPSKPRGKPSTALHPEPVEPRVTDFPPDNFVLCPTQASSSEAGWRLCQSSLSLSLSPWALSP